MIAQSRRRRGLGNRREERRCEINERTGEKKRGEGRKREEEKMKRGESFTK